MQLSLRDDVDSLMELELMVADRESAEKLSKRFQQAPERLYAGIIEAVCKE